MRYHIKQPGAFLWEPFVTDSLVSEVEQGRLKGDWKIRKEDDSTNYTVDELCQLESGRKGALPAAGGSVASEPPRPTSPPKRNSFYFLSVFLIADFLWCTLTAAHEFDSRELVYFSIGLDVLLVVSLIAAKMQISRGLPEDQKPWIAGNLLFFSALVAGLGLLAIRMNGDASWWTGHVRYELLPRR